MATNVLFVAPPMGLPFRNHWLPDALLDVSVTLPPVQKVVGPPGVIVGVAGGGLTVTVVGAEAALVQPGGAEGGGEGDEAGARGVSVAAKTKGLALRYHWLP